MVMSTDGAKPVGELAARTWVRAGGWRVVRGDCRDRLGKRGVGGSTGKE